MSPKQPREATNLFAAAGMEQDAPRPLPDRLRPRTLADGATAASVGFQKGDVILAVNNQKIAKTSDLDKASKVSSRLWRIVVVRGGQQINVTLGG